MFYLKLVYWATARNKYLLLRPQNHEAAGIVLAPKPRLVSVCAGFALRAYFNVPIDLMTAVFVISDSLSSLCLRKSSHTTAAIAFSEDEIELGMVLDLLNHLCRRANRYFQDYLLNFTQS